MDNKQEGKKGRGDPQPDRYPRHTGIRTARTVWWLWVKHS